MKKLIIVLFATFFAFNAYSAYLKNVPLELKQPDGSLIHCFITGDEFHRRVHDKDNYTIVQNSQTGYYVYALKTGNELVPSEHVVGKSEPKQLQILPNLDVPFQQMEEKRTETLKSAKIATENSTKGDFNNIVISIRFSDQNPTTLTFQDYESLFNSTTSVSLKSYYKEVSSSQLNVSTNFYPQPQNQIILEYQDSHPRAYYTQYNETTNPIGYKPIEYFEREQTLFKNAVENVKDQIIGSQINFDLNNDGFVDNLIFIMQGNVDGWGNILWPMSSGFTDSNIIIGNKKVSQFNKQLSSSLVVGTICHEFFHALGAPDLYHYSYDGFDPVGVWDIMGGSVPLHMTAFMKFKYGKWFEKLPEITQSGTYTLQPVSKSPFACYKIPSPDNPLEYFVIEYRKKEGLLETSIPASYDEGLIIYRVNIKVQWGNAGGPPDEIYIYRPDGSLTQNGDISKAAFSANSGRKAFNSNTNPSCFLSTGQKGWIDISNITTAGDQISFTVNASEVLFGPRNLTASLLNNQVLLKWNSPVKKGTGILGYNVFLAGSTVPINTSLITDTTYQTQNPGQKATYSYQVTAKYQQGESDPAICNLINFLTPSVKDSLALVALFNQCNGHNWTKKANWLNGPLKIWQGVFVENGRVVELHLDDWPNSVGLNGQLPAEISNLTEIRRLILANNQLTGTLSDSWISLIKLEWLVLGRNQFSGSLPESWSSLVNLQFLFLGSNQLSGYLPETWSSLEKLQVFSIPENKLTGNLPESWSSLVNIVDLSLDANQLTGALPESWSSFKKLDNLSLRDNQFSGTLPESWSSFSNLRQFQLDNNKLAGIIPKSWLSMTNMQFFSFERNLITDLPDLVSMIKLNYLLIGHNLLDFGDIEPNIGVPKVSYNYAPQGLVGKLETLKKKLGEECRITFDVGGNSNKYQWYKSGNPINNATKAEYLISSVALKDAGIYTCQITNTVAKELTLTSQPITLQITNQPPVANAGIDQTVNENEMVKLNGSVSSDPDGSALFYKWTVSDDISLSFGASANPIFKAPEVKKDSVLVFKLVVNDGTLDSNPKSVNITVQNVIKVGLEILGESDLKIYPNPTHQTVCIENSVNTKLWNLIILSVTGERISSYKISSAKTEIDVSNLALGVYFFQFKNKAEQVIMKILKD